MRNKNIWIGIGLVAAIALVAVLAMVLPTRIASPASDAPALAPDATIGSAATVEPAAEATPTAESPTQPAGAEETAPVTVTSPSGETSTPVPEDSEEPQATFDPSTIKAWLLVTAGSITYQPIPLIEEGEYSVIQEETGAENVIHVTTEIVDMKSSTCENQDCVKQGVVSLDNRDSRLLGNMIICLPNQVTLELYTTEELIQMLSGT